MIMIRYRGALSALTGKTEEGVDASRVHDVRGALHHIRSAYGTAAYKEAKKMLIVVDSISILLKDNFKTKLDEGAVVQFFPICGGG